MEIHCIFPCDVGPTLKLHHMVYNYMAIYQVCIFHQNAWQVHMLVANLQYSRLILTTKETIQSWQSVRMKNFMSEIH